MKQCRNCGKITDSNFCPDCGGQMLECENPLETKENIICTEYEKDVTEDVEVCEDAISTTNINEADTEDEVIVDTDSETNSFKEPKKGKKKIAIIALIIVIIGAIVVGVLVKKTGEKEGYAIDINAMAIMMLFNASDAEEVGDLILQVWHDAIFDEFNDETSKYTRGASDFNEALQNLFDDEEFYEKIIDLKDTAGLQQMMSGLKEPPAEYKEAYDAILTLYTDYLALIELVTDPNMSYTQYMQALNDAVSKFSEDYHKVDILLPEVELDKNEE